MKFPLSWLREFVAVDLPASELAHRLTMAGIETEVAEHVGEEWSRVFVGQVLELSKHERADNLSIVRVQGPDGVVTIVTAATNLSVGVRVPLILSGGTLGPHAIEQRTFMGVTSEGMICSGDELGISPDKAGIYILEDEAPIGQELASYLSDVVLESFVTPNRPDCLSVYGIAREVSAITGSELPPLHIERPAVQHIETPYPLDVAATDLAPRYTLAMVSGVQVRPSPLWLQRRLYFSGVRPISNVVDVTNYVMLEIGQPLHAFDRDKLREGIIVRRAAMGERMATLDGIERELNPEILVIADHERAVGIAGVMGGLTSEVSDETTRLALESAAFDQRNIRRTARDLRLGTEASRRFERGLDPALASIASDRAVQLLAELAGGYPVGMLQDVYPTPEQPRIITTSLAHIGSVMGREYAADEVLGTLRALGLHAHEAQGALTLTVPSHRRDIAGPHDIVEEVARITGYDSIPETLPTGSMPALETDQTRLVQDRIKAMLVGAGLQEIIAYSLVAPETATQADCSTTWPDDGSESSLIRVWNPMTSDRSALRQSLLPSILQTVSENLRHAERVALFEIARVYVPGDDILPSEPGRLCIAVSGRRAPVSWTLDHAPFDFFDLKGVIEGIGRVLHVTLEFRTSSHSSYHPGRCAEVIARDSGGSEHVFGAFGQIHPIVAERFNLDPDVYASELDMDALVQWTRDIPPVVAPARYPGVELDLAVMVEEHLAEHAVERAISAAGGDLLAHVRLFDVYRGAPVPDQWKSLAFSLTIRASDRTLTDDEAVAVRSAIERQLLAAFNAQIRGK
ncbi:MAG: phenylalanine--tRNA ligase subunit beta [Chloroflexota bacterium]